MRSAATLADDDLDEPLVLGLVEADLAGPGQVGRDVDDDVDLLGGEGGVRAGVVGVGRDRERRRSNWDAVAVIASVEAGRSRLDEPDLRRLVVVEQDARDDDRADHEERREQHAEDEAAAPPALDDLALGDQPDAAQAAHRGTSSVGSRDRLHEQLGQLRWLVGEATDLAGGLRPREQRLEVDRLVDEQLDPAVAALQDGQRRRSRRATSRRIRRPRPRGAAARSAT